MKTHAMKQKQRLTEPISIIAHQLKNPIAVIKSYVEVLLAESIGPMTPQQKEYLRDMDSNVKRMRQLVSKLLDVSRIEENRFEMNQKIFDLFPLVKDVVDDVSMWARTKGSVITLGKKRGDTHVYTDPIKIREVVADIISNAIKYNPSSKGSITVSVTGEEEGVVFRCEDNGIGIRQEDEHKLFSKFYRSDEATNLDSRGTGLGLYLSKAIIEQSNGSIGYNKNSGQGVTFYFRLPKAP